MAFTGLSNDQMIAGRFARWGEARRKEAWIRERVEAGFTVYLSTVTHHTTITAKHLSLIKATKTGLYIRRGKKWLCYDGAKISAQWEH